MAEEYDSTGALDRAPNGFEAAMDDGSHRVKQVCIIACITSTILTVVGLGPMPYGFYTLLRTAFCTGAICGVVWSRTLHNTGWAWALAVIGFVYNPIVPIRLHQKSLWIVANLVTLGVLWSAVALLSRKQREADRAANTSFSDADQGDGSLRQLAPPTLGEHTASDLAHELVDYALSESERLFVDFKAHHRISRNKRDTIQFETFALAIVGVWQGAIEELSESFRVVFEIEMDHALKATFENKQGRRFSVICAKRGAIYKLAGMGPNVDSEPVEIVGRVFTVFCQGKSPSPEDIGAVRWNDPLLLLGSRLYLRTYQWSKDHVGAKQWAP